MYKSFLHRNAEKCVTEYMQQKLIKFLVYEIIKIYKKAMKKYDINLSVDR